MLRRLAFASALICCSLALTGCSTVLPGWRVSASQAGCERHLGFVITDANGELREVEHPREVIPNWPETNDLGKGTMQITRGEGGWWVANKGTLSTEYGPYGGALAWLADGSSQFEVVAEGRYVGVATVVGETWAVRGECPFSYGHSMQTSHAVLERITPTTPGTPNSGSWAAPVEVQRFADLCPTHALADRDGRPLVVGINTAVYKDELFRIEGDQLHSLGVIGGEWYRDLGDQAELTDAGDVLISSGWWNWAPDVVVTQALKEEAMARAQVLRRFDDDHFIPGYLVRHCRVTRLTPETALGIEVERRRGQTWIDVLPYHRDIGDIVNYVNSLDGPVTLWIYAIEMNGRPYDLLDLRPGTTLHLLDSMYEYELAPMREKRPDLFEEPSTWRAIPLLVETEATTGTDD